MLLVVFRPGVDVDGSAAFCFDIKVTVNCCISQHVSILSTGGRARPGPARLQRRRGLCNFKAPLIISKCTIARGKFGTWCLTAAIPFACLRSLPRCACHSANNVRDVTRVTWTDLWIKNPNGIHYKTDQIASSRPRCLINLVLIHDLHYRTYIREHFSSFLYATISRNYRTRLL